MLRIKILTHGVFKKTQFTTVNREIFALVLVSSLRPHFQRANWRLTKFYAAKNISVNTSEFERIQDWAKLYAIKNGENNTERKIPCIQYHRHINLTWAVWGFVQNTVVTKTTVGITERVFVAFCSRYTCTPNASPSIFAQAFPGMLVTR